MARTGSFEEPNNVEQSATITRAIGIVVAGSYRLTRHIGSGGSSHVFEAEHVRLGKAFAVKLLRPELDPTRQTAQRFRREARAIARLRSEYTVSVVDCGELPDQTPYLVMELLEGEDLRTLLKREGCLPALRAVPIIIEACRALAEAHRAGLVHRDLKPENLFISRRSTGEDWCKVLDFGVAKMDASLATTQGAIVGTVRYMAPEQLTDGATVGVATDIHALGAILYECLSGRPALPGESIQEAMFSVLNRTPKPLENVPDQLSALTLQCLAKDPARRPRSAQALESLLGEAVSRQSTAQERTLTEEDQMPPSSSSGPSHRPASLSLPLVPVALGVLVSALGVAWLWPKTEAPTHDGTQESEPIVVVPTRPMPASSAASLEPPALPLGAVAAGVTATARASASATPVKAAPRVANAATSTVPTPASPLRRAPTVGNLDPANPYSE